MNNNPIGYIKVETYKGNRAYPVSGADVIISKKVEDNYQIVYKTTTNQDGSTELIKLDAVDKAKSLSPNQISPYATYKIEVTKPGFVKKVYDMVPVFEDNVTLQIVSMVPISAGESEEIDYNIPKNELENIEEE